MNKKEKRKKEVKKTALGPALLSARPTTSASAHLTTPAPSRRVGQRWKAGPTCLPLTDALWLSLPSSAWWVPLSAHPPPHHRAAQSQQILRLTRCRWLNYLPTWLYITTEQSSFLPVTPSWPRVRDPAPPWAVDIIESSAAARKSSRECSVLRPSRSCARS
jgi:hypothetical protein